MNAEEEKRSILAELVELGEPPTVRASDVSLRDYMAATGASESAARNRLERLVKEGKYESAMAYCSERCRHVRVWRRVLT